MEHISGIVFSVPMFYKNNGDIDLSALEGYLDRFASDAGVSCLYAMAFNTRYLQLSQDEIDIVNRLVCEAGRAHKTPVIIGHPIGLNERDLNRFCERSSNFGADAISILYPERFFGQHDPILSYLSIPANAGLKTIIHEMKLVSGFDGSLMDWPIDLIDEAISLPSIAGIKEDSKNDTITRYVLQRYRSQTNVIVAGGGKSRATTLADSTGIDTWLNGSLMLNPMPATRIYRAITTGESKTIHQYLSSIERPYFEKVVAPLGWHVAHKLALVVAGYAELAERLPMPIATREQRQVYEPVIESVLLALDDFLEKLPHDVP